MNLSKIYEREVDLVPSEMKIHVYPDPILHQRCEDVVIFDDDNDQFLSQLFVDMALTMVNNQGIGIAAPQVGISANFIVLLVQNPGAEKPEPIALVNPKIISASEDMFEWEEGCLSVPGFYEDRKRPRSVVVEFKDLVGKERSIELNGLYAFSIQHEIDHLNGHLFIDELSAFKRKFSVEKKIKKYLKKRKR